MYKEYILEFRSCPERFVYQIYLCISKESSEEHPDVFSDVGVEDDDTDLKN